ncbi:MATE family efflux transporter [Halorussus gelatinilyticus]|uniref:Multidrug-efflux transporter n=1 Tax=Halorussus gelatinilyticus TaxID=2937524 RepID=A0A8U0IFP8_9EURY|nr:MATE family efflux transporter [Halorussus gelatinilyticus]UPV99041.1 MATE family efflux transporter [Halorussus gelatinilyticus]
MTTGAITPKLVSLAWPLVAGNLLQTFYNLADMFWVGRVGPNAVAAVSLMFPTAWMFVSVAMGLTAASVALVSQHVGAGDDRKADNVVAQTTILTVAVALVLSALGYVFRHPLLSLVGAEGRVYAYSLQYIEVLFLSIPFTFLFFVFRAVLRGAGDTRTAMWLMVLSAGANVVLDPFLVLGYGPFPEWGVRGAAVATLISRILTAVIGVAILVKGDWGVRLRLDDLRPDWPVLRKLVDVGYPGTLDGLARSFAAVAMAALVARFGAVPTAAYGIGLRLMSVSWTVSGAVGQATATGVGQNLGAETPDRAATVTWTATGGTMAVLFGVGALMVAFPDEAMRVFIADAAVVAAGVEFLRIIGPFLAFFGGLMVLQGGFRGAGDTRTAMALSVLSRWLLRIPAALLVAYSWTVTVAGVPLTGWSWGVEGLWWAWSFSAIASFLVGVAWFGLGRWREGVVEREETATPGD